MLKGRILEALDNRALASEAFKEALRVDAYCLEAFRALITHEILTADEEKELLTTIPIAAQSDSPGGDNSTMVVDLLNFQQITTLRFVICHV